jgi:hypothetical protein
MLNQEAARINVPGRVARARGRRTKHECRSCRAVDDARTPFHGLRGRSLATKQWLGGLELKLRSQMSDRH